MARCNRLFLPALFFLLAAVSAAPTYAQTTFYYDGYGGFTSGTDTPGGSATYEANANTATGGGTWDVGADPDIRNPAGTFPDVIWGTSPVTTAGPYAGLSGLALSKVEDGTVQDDSVPVLLGTLTHFNRDKRPPDLESTQMTWTLALFDNPGAAAAAEGSGNANAIYEQTTLSPSTTGRQ